MSNIASKTAEQIMGWLITLAGAFYLAFATTAKWLTRMAYMGTPILGISSPWIYCAIGFAVFCAAFLLLLFLRKKGRPLFHIAEKQQKLNPGLFFAVTIPVFLLYLLFWAINHPGGISTDNVDQWAQLASRTFNDHHPAFHTLLLYWITRICHSYSFILLVQLIAFACGMGYLAVTLHSWGFPRWAVDIIVFILACGFSTQHVMLYAWKDTALSLFFLFLLSHIINIFLSRGEWLKKPGRWIISAVLLACITLVRHNAILFTAPLLFFSFFWFPKKACAKLIALVCILVVLVKGPVYSYYQVSPASDSYKELVGLPMTILSTVYAKAPQDRVPQKVNDYFAAEFADRETFGRIYGLGSFNSVKWAFNFTEEKMQKLTPAELLEMTWQSLRTNSQLSVLSVIELTDLVYNPFENDGCVTPYVSSSPLVAQMNLWPQSEALRSFSAFCKPCVDFTLNIPPLQMLTSANGVLMIVMLLAWYVSHMNIHKWRSLWLVFPIVIYNFGTMLLLCGNDGRFFHFNCLAAYPIALVLLSTQSHAPSAAQSALE